MAGVGQLPGQLTVPCARTTLLKSRDQCQIEGLRASFVRRQFQFPSVYGRRPDVTILSHTLHLQHRRLRRGKMASRAALSTGCEPTTVVVQTIDFKNLQNGSDIRGVAVPGVEGESVNLMEPVTEAIAAGFAGWLTEKKNNSDGRRQQLKVSIGHDSRISSDSLQSAAARGLSEAGLGVVLYGLASTPCMFNSTLTKQQDLQVPVDGSIMLTASHLPYNRNGLKFFTSGGGLGKGDILDILARASKIYEGKISKSQKAATVSDSEAGFNNVDYMQRYTEDLVADILE